MILELELWKNRVYTIAKQGYVVLTKYLGKRIAKHSLEKASYFILSFYIVV
jgi:hypothetical protein